jgi:predicted membrane-bound spermidine synthase
MQQTLEMDFLTGVIISQLFFLLPPIIGMGMVSPMLISMIAEHNESGKAAGLVYAVSTLGGVIATMLTGFWLVPLIGISVPCVVIGALLFLLSIIVLRPSNKIAPVALLILLVPSALFIYGTNTGSTDKYKVVYYTEGMLGQVKVVDFTYSYHDNNIKSRVMLVNHNWQTWVSTTDEDFSFLYYTRFTNAVISSLPKDSRALLIGLGGGTVAKQMEKHHVNYDAVEIDGRLPKLAEKYFGLKTAVANTAIDDGRHYVNVCKKKYDLIIIDALLGENVPSHLLSLECFQKMKTLLNPNGKIFIEFDGVNDEEPGVAQSALKNTLEKAGYNCRTFSSYPNRTNFDMMYVATTGIANNYDTAQIIPNFYYPFSGPLKKFEVSLEHVTDDIVTDNNPSLDYYLRNRMIAFRQNYLLNFNKDFLDDQMPFFH